MYGPPPYRPPRRSGVPGPAVAGIAILCVMLGVAGGCVIGVTASTAPPPEGRPVAASSATASAGPEPSPSPSSAPAGPASTSPSPSPSAAPAKIRVPDVAGKNHQEAQNLMQDAGLYGLVEEDATGQGRALILDRNWVVVRQSPKAGTQVAPDATITLYSKKIGE